MRILPPVTAMAVVGLLAAIICSTAAISGSQEASSGADHGLTLRILVRQLDSLRRCSMHRRQQGNSAKSPQNL